MWGEPTTSTMYTIGFSATMKIGDDVLVQNNTWGVSILLSRGSVWKVNKTQNMLVSRTPSEKPALSSSASGEITLGFACFRVFSCLIPKP